MIISKKHLNKNNIIAEVKAEFNTFDNSFLNSSLDKEFNFEDLLNGNLEIHHINTLFKRRSENFEKILFKIHYKRKKIISLSDRKIIISFLCSGYFNTKDIRYFNEFLWFFKKKPFLKKYLYFMNELFFDNINKQNQHCFIKNDLGKIKKFITSVINDTEKNKFLTGNKTKKVGLFGSPTFFKRIRRKLMEIGYSVDVFFIPFHSKKYVNFLFNNKSLFNIFLKIYNINFDYKTLAFDKRSNDANNIPSKNNLDVGFHKLGFIIKDKIINAFKIGLINDHWAALPFIRGRSSIEYSLLMGIPIVTTSHIVLKKIDEGNIIAMFSYDNTTLKYKKIKQIRNHIRRDFERRAIQSLLLLSSKDRTIFPNISSDGFTYFSMHKCLLKFIEKNILRNRK